MRYQVSLYLLQNSARKKRMNLRGLSVCLIAIIMERIEPPDRGISVVFLLL